MGSITEEVVIIGAGMMGVTVGLEFTRRFPDQKIIVVENDI